MFSEVKMPVVEANCAKTQELIYIHHADDGMATKSFPCVCGEVHEGDVPGPIERVSRGSFGGPNNGDARFCPEGHAALYGRHRFSHSGSVPQDNYATGWRCANSKHDYFEEK
jgi:hypothetical protein